MTEYGFHSYQGHSTHHEILFLRGLGGFNEGVRLNGPSRRILLERYLHAAHRRVNWGAMDAELVLDAAREMARMA